MANDGSEPQDSHDARLLCTSNKVWRTKEIVSVSKREIKGMKKTIADTNEMISTSRELCWASLPYPAKDR